MRCDCKRLVTHLLGCSGQCVDRAPRGVVEHRPAERGWVKLGLDPGRVEDRPDFLQTLAADDPEVLKHILFEEFGELELLGDLKRRRVVPVEWTGGRSSLQWAVAHTSLAPIEPSAAAPLSASLSRSWMVSLMPSRSGTTTRPTLLGGREIEWWECKERRPHRDDR